MTTKHLSVLCMVVSRGLEKSIHLSESLGRRGSESEPRYDPQPLFSTVPFNDHTRHWALLALSLTSWGGCLCADCSDRQKVFLPFEFLSASWKVLATGSCFVLWSHTE